MYTKLTLLAGKLTMRATILEAWKKRLVGWFNIGLIFLVAFIALFWVLPRFLPKKKTRSKRYAKLTLAALAIGLLLMLLSLLSGIGFGFGIGKGSGFGKGKGSDVGIGEGTTDKQQQYKNEGELDIAITGCTVYIDEEEIPIDKVSDHVLKKYKDSLKVVLIDAYSDYAIYTRVEAILNDLLPKGKYEIRKEN